MPACRALTLPIHSAETAMLPARQPAGALMPSRQVVAGGEGLRVAIVADRTHVPRYVIDVIRAALNLPGLDLVGLYAAANQPAAEWSIHLFDGLDEIEHLVGRCRGRRGGDLDKADLAEALSTPMLGPIDLVMAGQRLVPSEAAIGQLIARDLDVLICCTQAPLAMPAGIARHGALGIEIGYGVSAQASWAGAAELAGGSPVMLVRLVDYSAPGAKALYEATAAMIGTSVQRNRRTALAKGGAVLRRLLKSLGQAGGGQGPVPRLLDWPNGYPRGARPSARLFAGACRQMGRQLLKNRLDSKIGFDLWHLAYCFSDKALPEVEFDRLRYLAPRLGTFWADPFPLIHQGRHYILFEELPYDSLRGRLLAVEVAEEGPAGAPMTVLERDYHLSYPQIFHWQGELYMVPETKHAGRVELLRCVRFPSQWALHSVLLDNIRAVDATLRHQDGSWWMFVNVALEGLESADELHLYYADSLFGEWRPHPANPVCADVRCARPGGPLFEMGGELFRPSQDCAAKYGGALWINRIERLDRTGFRERPVGRIAPDWHPDVSTVHTLGRAGRLTVLDCVVDDRGGLDVQRAD